MISSLIARTIVASYYSIKLTAKAGKKTAIFAGHAAIEIIKGMHIILKGTGLYPYLIGGALVWFTRHRYLYPAMEKYIYQEIYNLFRKLLLKYGEDMMLKVANQAAEQAATQAATQVASQAATEAVAQATDQMMRIAQQQNEPSMVSEILKMTANVVTNAVIGTVAQPLMLQGGPVPFMLQDGPAGRVTKKTRKRRRKKSKKKRKGSKRKRSKRRRRRSKNKKKTLISKRKRRKYI